MDRPIRLSIAPDVNLTNRPGTAKKKREKIGRRRGQSGTGVSQPGHMIAAGHNLGTPSASSALAACELMPLAFGQCLRHEVVHAEQALGVPREVS
jgi:hypothetical protein